MKIIEVKNTDVGLEAELLSLWESSVRVSHTFLSNNEIKKIKTYVPAAINGVEHLVVARDENNRISGFMGVDGGRLEMLFVAFDSFRLGIGKALLDYGIKNYNVNTLTVNEQNPKAVGFYEYMGFETYKRSDLDEQGNPYPILYMRLR